VFPLYDFDVIRKCIWFKISESGLGPAARDEGIAEGSKRVYYYPTYERMIKVIS
jgi:hypothetical protein